MYFRQAQPRPSALIAWKSNSRLFMVNQKSTVLDYEPVSSGHRGLLQTYRGITT